jgi:hypothetical protein
MSMKFDWTDYMAFTNPPFFTFMALWLFVAGNLAARLIAIVFLVIAIWFWLLWGAVLACYYQEKIKRERRRQREFLEQLRSHRPCMTFCHNTGAPIPPHKIRVPLEEEE